MFNVFSFSKTNKWLLATLAAIGLFMSFLFVMAGGGLGSRHDTIDYSQPLLFSHRGIANYYAENSREAFDASLELGFESVEIDVMFTKDKKLIVFHDESCERLLGLDEKVEDLNAEEILSHYLIHNGEKTTNKVLLLDDFLKSFTQSQTVYMDIKESSFEMADSIINIIRRYNLEENVLVADQRFYFISYVKYKAPEIKTVLESFSRNGELLYHFMPKNFKPDYYASSFYMDKDHLEFIKKHDLLDKYIVYSIDKDNFDKAYKKGFKNVIIDYDYSLGMPEQVVYVLISH